MRGCEVRTDGDQLTIRPTLSTLGLPIIVMGLGLASLVYGVNCFPKRDYAPEYLAFAPIGLFLLVVGRFWYRSSARPLVLDRQADRVIGYPHELSSAVKVIVKSVPVNDGNIYVVEVVFPRKRFRLSRSGWSGVPLPQEADRLAKTVGEFLGVPVEPYFADYPTVTL